MPDKKSPALNLLRTVFFILYACGLIYLAYFLRPMVMERIRVREELVLKEKLKEVLPVFDNRPWKESFELQGVRVYPARHEQEVAFETPSSEIVSEIQQVKASMLSGFALRAGGGEVPLFWIAFDLQGNISGLSLAAEGLAGDEDFLKSFLGASPESLEARDFSEDGRMQAWGRVIRKASVFFRDNKPEFFMKANEAEAAR